MSHCDPNVDIVASMRIPYHAWRITVFITDAALLGRALAPLGTAPTEIAIADSPINRDAFFFPPITMRHAASLRSSRNGFS